VAGTGAGRVSGMPRFGRVGSMPRFGAAAWRLVVALNWLPAIAGVAAVMLALSAPPVPAALPRTPPLPATSLPSRPGEPGIDINRLDAATLADVLPGVGVALAERIVVYRTLFGPLRSADDLLALGLSAAAVERVRHLLRYGT